MKPTGGTHESLAREQEVIGSSDRSFGLTFTGFFLLVGLWPLARGGPVRAWAFGVSALFLVAALVRPGLLAPLNRLWLRVGLVLHRVVNPLVMGVMFYGVITPFGLAMRAAGRDPLRKRFDPLAQSYWIERRPPGPTPETMSNQF
ncbi:MAG: SxtJ family membrane protein [Candidatus Rokuibacteriota bacterium]